jgi:DNA modification methylase
MNEIITADCFDALEQFDEDTFHACVTDPPYGLAFMGKSWDDFEPKEYQEWCEEWASAVKRVLKPGGHLLAFSGNRTHHRLFTGVEDAGFEIRDTVTWHYGSGFPKASDISKTIDKRADAEREDLGPNPNAVGQSYNKTGGDYNNDHKENRAKHDRITEPAAEEAKEWDGFKTALKPATEYVVVARKPFEGATVDCVLEHGTGALNIDGCRIETDKERPLRENTETGDGDTPGGFQNASAEKIGTTTEGRYPSNVIFDETEAAALDEEVGELSSGKLKDEYDLDKSKANDTEVYSDVSSSVYYANLEEATYGDSGGPSRFFYTSKANKSERTLDGRIDNAHPTVKPQDLMEWLVKLVTAENQTVVDPFAGSGTTCKAAKELKRRFVGIEKQSKWADVARVRVGLTPEDPSVVRDDGPQSGLEAFE